MIEQAILHIIDSQFCFPTNLHTLKLRLRIAKEDFPTINVVYGGKYEYAQIQYKTHMQREFVDSHFAYYTAELKLKDSRCVYVFEIIDQNETRYFSEDGLTKTYDFELNYYNAFQMPYINEIDVHNEVSWLENAVFYQIFVERFSRGNFIKDDKYINMKWGELPSQKGFAGGDLIGIANNLDYLKELGVTALYLTPIFESPSNHKYDVVDYYKVDKQFGSNEDFGKLVKMAHEKGLKIVLDAVFNHCSSDCSIFQDVKNKGRMSEYYEWFLIDGDKPDEKKMNYDCFASCQYMPKWNTSNLKLQEFLINVATYWIKEYDIDGWRLDVSDEVSHNFWRNFKIAVKKEKKECLILGENWHDANSYLKGDQYDSIMNYAFTKACLDFFAFERTSAKDFAEKLNELLMRNTDQVNSMMMNLLDSHDTHRFMTRVGENKDKLMSAIAVTFMFVGAPCIYYGTENAMVGGYDPDCRRTFDSAEITRENEVKSLIKKLANLKKQKIIGGKIAICETDGLFSLKRINKDSTIELLINNTKNPIAIKPFGEIVAVNNFVSENLLPDGFVIFKN
ncbi:MAG: glycoside hydrolase family 13 protein [Clostridia bacterium]